MRPFNIAKAALFSVGFLTVLGALQVPTVHSQTNTTDIVRVTPGGVIVNPRSRGVPKQEFDTIEARLAELERRFEAEVENTAQLRKANAEYLYALQARLVHLEMVQTETMACMAEGRFYVPQDRLCLEKDEAMARYESHRRNSPATTGTQVPTRR